MGRYRNFDTDIEKLVFSAEVDDLVIRTVSWDQSRQFDDLKIKNADWISKWIIHNSIDSSLKLFNFGIWKSNLPVGQIIVWNFDSNAKEAYLSYWIDQGHSRQGLMYKALGRVLDLDLDLKTIYAPIQKDNTPSINLVTKLGFTFDSYKSYETSTNLNMPHSLYKKDL